MYVGLCLVFAILPLPEKRCFIFTFPHSPCIQKFSANTSHLNIFLDRCRILTACTLGRRLSNDTSPE